MSEKISNPKCTNNLKKGHQILQKKNLGAKIPPQNAQKTQKGILKTNLNATRNTRCVPELVPEPAQFLPVNARARSYPTFQYPSPLDTRLFATRCIPRFHCHSIDSKQFLVIPKNSTEAFLGSLTMKNCSTFF